MKNCCINVFDEHPIPLFFSVHLFTEIEFCFMCKHMWPLETQTNLCHQFLRQKVTEISQDALWAKQSQLGSQQSKPIRNHRVSSPERWYVSHNSTSRASFCCKTHGPHHVLLCICVQRTICSVVPLLDSQMLAWLNVLWPSPVIKISGKTQCFRQSWEVTGCGESCGPPHTALYVFSFSVEDHSEEKHGVFTRGVLAVYSGWWWGIGGRWLIESRGNWTALLRVLNSRHILPHGIFHAVFIIFCPARA